VLAYAARRLLVTLPLLLVVSVLCFALTDLLPGDPSATRLGQHRTKETAEEYRKALGLDDPFPVRYVRFLSSAARFDFGEDWFKPGVRVGDELRHKFPATIELALCAMTIAVVVGLLVGTRAAAKPRGPADWLGQTAALLGTSIPVFWLGMMAILLFTSVLGWTELMPDWSPRHVAPDARFSTDFLLLESLFRGDFPALWTALQSIALPALVLSTIPLAVITRMTRSSMLEELSRDYVRTARAKGVPEGRVVTRHALRNALVPIVTITGLQTGALLGGAVLTETVFAWPGLGTHVVTAVREHDSPVVVAGVLLFSATFVVVNLVVDLLYHAIDPRLRRGAKG
jgi:peptide/nickel transport system permease protein